MSSSNVIYVDFHKSTAEEATDGAKVEKEELLSTQDSTHIVNDNTPGSNSEGEELKKAIISNDFDTTAKILNKPKTYIDKHVDNPLRFAMRHNASTQLFALLLDHLSEPLEALIRKYPTWGAAFILSAANEELDYFSLLTKKYSQDFEKSKKSKESRGKIGRHSTNKAKSLDCNNSRAVLKHIIEQTNYFRDGDGNDALHRACMSPFTQRHGSQTRTVDYVTARENVAFGDFQEVEKFIVHSPNVNALNNDGYSPLALAIEEKLDCNVIRKIIARYEEFDLNFKNDVGNSLLHLLCKSGNSGIKTIKELLRRGVDINAKNNFGQTPIFFFSHGFELRTLKFMHRCGASLTELDNSGCSLLNTYDLVPLIEYVLEHSNLTTDYKNKLNEDVFCALSRELHNYTQDKIEFFKKYGLTINSKLSNGSYPILEFLKNCPIYSKVIDHIKYMVIVYELDLKVVDDKGRNAAIISSISPRNQLYPIAAINYLLERDVNFDYAHVDANGQNILHHLFQGKEYFSGSSYSANRTHKDNNIMALIAYLKTLNFDFNQKDNANNTPLDYLKKLKIPGLIKAYNLGLGIQFSDTLMFKKRNDLVNGLDSSKGKSFTDFEYLRSIFLYGTTKAIDVLYYIYKTFRREEVAAFLNQESYAPLLGRAIYCVNSYYCAKETIIALYRCGAKFPTSTKEREAVIEDLVKISCGINPAIFDEFKERRYMIKAIACGLANSFFSVSSNTFIKGLIAQLGEITYEEKFQFLSAALGAKFSNLEYAIKQKLISLDFSSKKFIECIKNHRVEFFEQVEKRHLSLIIEKLGDFLIYVDKAMKDRNDAHKSKKRYGALEYFCRFNICSYKIENGHATWPTLIEYLIEQLGYDVNEYIEYTPLASLVLSNKSNRGNKIVWAEYLIDAGADINLGSGPDKAPPLAIAIVDGNEDFYELLLTGRYSKNDQRYKELKHIKDTCSSQYSHNIISDAVSEGEMSFGQFAKEANFKRKTADIEAKTIDGNTPLLHALINSIGPYSLKGSWQLIERFVNEYNPDLLAQNNNGQNLLHIITAADTNIDSDIYGEILKSIINKAVVKGINLDAKDTDNNTPLYLALSTKKIDLFYMLVELGADPSIKSGKENLPLVYYAYNKELLSFLMDYLDINQNHLEDLYHKFCTNFGSQIEDPRMLDYFLGSGYLVNHVFKDGSTAIALLAKGGGFKLPKGYRDWEGFDSKELAAFVKGEN